MGTCVVFVVVVVFFFLGGGGGGEGSEIKGMSAYPDQVEFC